MIDVALRGLGGPNPLGDDADDLDDPDAPARSGDLHAHTRRDLVRGHDGLTVDLYVPRAARLGGLGARGEQAHRPRPRVDAAGGAGIPATQRPVPPTPLFGSMPLRTLDQ